MVRYGKPGEELVRQTPLTLLTLTRHEIEPQEEHWFARCRSDYLRSFPLTLLECVRLAITLCLVTPSAHRAPALFAVLACALVVSTQYSVLLLEAAPGVDEKLALRYRRGTVRLRAFLWTVALAWTAAVCPDRSISVLAALTVVMMAIDGISVMTLPHLALGSSVGGGAALVLGLTVRHEESAAMIAVAVLAMATFMHWTIYNLYYMFATRRIRTRRLSEAHDTVQLLLNQYDDEGSDWLYEVDGAGFIHNPSSRFCAASGRTTNALEGLPFLDLFDVGPQRDDLQEKLRSLAPFRNIIVPLTIRNETKWWSISGRPVEGSSNLEKGWRGFIADISTAQQAEAKVSYMAHYDQLTQLPNRILFTATLERALERREGKSVICLLYIDLDHFKAINDSFGHAVGDSVLAEVARRLEKTVPHNGMIARLGGDEFVVLLPELNSVDGGLIVAERVQKAISEPLEVEGQAMPTGASVGIAFAPHDALTGEDLLRCADLAMYDAKSRGRHGISVFNQDMQNDMQERRALELDLRVAIARQELVLHYQPLLDIRTDTVAGYEALIRWNHSTRGLISPLQFIPIAEETGMIVEIGNWVLRTALAEASRWPDDITIAVNISPVQIRELNFLAVVVGALAQSGIAAHRLELEITEGLLMQESAEVRNVLHRLRDLGVRIALDDFGTGYSSLNYLRSFPFDKIKIDRCFVSELTNREDCQAIIRSVLALASDLNMTTIAEGVEVSEQLEMLREGGCDQVQGFLFSKPVPSAMLPYGQAPAQSAGSRPSILPVLTGSKSGRGNTRKNNIETPPVADLKYATK